MGYRHFVLSQEFKEIISKYPVMTFRQPECGQAVLTNPAYYRHFTHAAMPGDETGSHIFRTPLLFYFFQVSLPESVS
jgi:hypothetical protein